jgi:hypothetical protein
MEISPQSAKKRSVRSWVWEHFKVSSPTEASCNHCVDLVSSINGTNKLKHHLLSHSIFKPETNTTVKATKRMKTENPLQQVITTKLYTILNYIS